LCALEGLALALLIAAQHQRLVGWVEIEADYVPEFLFESRVVRQLEGLHAVRLDVIAGPDALHGTRRNASVPRHRTNTPTAPARRRTRRLGDDARHLRRRNRSLAAAARFVGKSVQARPDKASGPHGDPLGRRAQPFGDGFDAETLDAQQDDVGTLAIAHTDCRGPQTASQFRHNAWLSQQPLDRPCHPRNSQP
jgi:hypothetical protein